MAVEQQLGDFNHPRCPLPHQLNPSRFQKVRTCQLDRGWTGHFDNYIPPKILLMN